MAVETRRDVDGDLIFVATNGEKIALSRQMIIALDEALSVAQAGNEVYVASYLFAYALDLPAGTKAIQLPVNNKVRILAVSVANEGPRAMPAGSLYMADYPDKLVVPPPPAAPPKRVGGGN